MQTTDVRTVRSGYSPLRILLAMDAAVLFGLGWLLICAPRQVEAAFSFKDLPEGVGYILGLWGCVLVTVGAGYAVAAMDPIRHLVWVQVGIARGVLECVLGVIYLARGVVNWPQAGAGILVAAGVTVAYILTYPRRPRAIPGAVSPPAGASPEA